jgi:hypothetical protein
MSFVQSLSGNQSWTAICSSSDGSIMYASCGINIYKCTDYGITWSSIYTTSPTNIQQLVCNNVGTCLVAAIENGALYSTNSGSSFVSFVNSSIFYTNTLFSITSDTTPRIYGISVGVSKPAYISNNNSTWSLFVAQAASPFYSISCGDSASGSTGYIYINGNNTKIYTSNNGGSNAMVPYPSNPIFQSVTCSQIVCAYTSSNNIFTISGDSIIYNTSGGSTSYDVFSLSNTPIYIIVSYDGTKVAYVSSDGNIYYNSNFPTNSFTQLTGYPSGSVFTSLTGNIDLSIISVTIDSNSIYTYNVNASSFTFTANFTGGLGLVRFNNLVLYGISIGGGSYLINNILSGTIIYDSSTVSASLIAIGGYNSNDNNIIPTSLTQTFTSFGLGIADITNSYNYLLNYTSSRNRATDSNGDTNVILNVNSACYLKGTKIITSNGLKNIEDLTREDLIKIVAIVNEGTNDLNDISFFDGYLPIKSLVKFDFSNHIPKEYYAPIFIKKDAFSRNYPSEDLWLSREHRVSYKKEYYQCVELLDFEELKENVYVDYEKKELIYYHIELNNHCIINVSGLNSETLYDFYSEGDTIGKYKRSGIIIF